MFTGIIEETGKVQSITKDKIVIECSKVLENTKLGDSIAVNGVCLTVVELLTKGFTADISPETSKITILHKLKNGDIVNLERAMKADGRFGGHIVSGHVDGLGKIINCEKKNDFFELNIDLPSNLAIYTIKKGSITINGISLTIAEIKNNIIKVAIIPHTFENTNLSFLKSGDFVNIEVDILAKYVEKFLSTSDNKSRISLEYLQEHGF
ncbi:riboflavin synthase [bacterium]|nr:riboflavin synthase [bacterium]